MARLFTYTIPVDDGAAPNPFFGMCSLAICKPGIRRVAESGDWVAGLGAKRCPSGNLSEHLVYAMHVEQVLTMQEYDQRALREWPYRIPNIDSTNTWERLGDCIYDYSDGSPRQRPGVHGAINKTTDLGGVNVLISRDFYYLGRNAIKLPINLLPICLQGQGHRSDSNAPYFERFVSWVRSLGLAPGKMQGWPDFSVDWKSVASCGGCVTRRKDGERDSPCLSTPPHE